MFVDKFTRYVIGSRNQAIGLALLFTVIPFCAWISAIIIVLRTWVNSTYEGFLVTLWIALPYVVLAATGFKLPFLLNYLGGLFVVWLMAALFRKTKDWSLALEVLVVLGILVVAGIHVFIPNIQVFWLARFNQFIKLITTHLQLNKVTIDILKQMGPKMVFFATGMNAAYMIFTVLVELALARILQSRLFIVGQFNKDWTRLKLHAIASLVFLTLCVLAYFNIMMSRDLLSVAALPFLIAGLGFWHFYLSKLKAGWLWLYYGIVIIAAMFYPPALGFFIIVAMIDSIFNFRQRLT